MKTREYLEAAEAFEQAAERCQIEHDGYEAPRAGWNMRNTIDCEYSGYQRACNELAAKFLAKAKELRAQAAQVKEQEPVAYLDHEKKVVGIGEASLGGGFTTSKGRAIPDSWTPLYTHPAPAPTEHTAADAPSSNAGNLQALKAAKEPSAVGVPDVAGLQRYKINCKFGAYEKSDTGFWVKHRDVAPTLVALQGQLETKHARLLEVTDIGTGLVKQGREDSATIAQQAAQITEMRELIKEVAMELEAAINVGNWHQVNVIRARMLVKLEHTSK